MKYPDVPLITSSSASSVDQVEVINVARLIEARKQDIFEFLNTLAEGRKHNRSFQKLPYHQRRRAMSRNPFRVPKRFRLPIVIDLLAGRNHKRRLGRVKWRKDLRVRRFGENKWLTTHIFHAKRFKMVNIWGYRLAETPTLKCQRKIYRSLNASNGCLLYDKSYFTIYGNSSSVNKGFASLKPLIKRKTVLFYDQNGILVSPIHIMHSANDCDLAVSIHPAAKTQFLNCISANQKNSDKKDTNNIYNSSLHKLFDYVVTAEIRDISHFELLGPQSLNIMCKTLKLTEFNENDYFTSEGCSVPKNSCNGTIFHLKIGLPDCAFKKFDSVEAEQLIAKSIKYTHILTKTKKNKINRAILEREKLKLQNLSSHDPYITSQKDAYLENESKAENIITFEAIVITRHLISSFRPYKRVSGFDLLVPSQISRYVWNRLYKNGGLPIGLEERRKIYLELGQPIFPEDFPETMAGHQYHNARDQERRNQFLKMNTRYRPNYIKLNIVEPLSTINLMSLLSNKCDNFTTSKFMHAIITSIKRCVPKEMCRIYLVPHEGNMGYNEVGFVISGYNTFTKGKGFAKCLILRSTTTENCKFVAKNINSRHYFPIEIQVIQFNHFID